jgi:hypothetical protein
MTHLIEVGCDDVNWFELALNYVTEVKYAWQ